MLVGFFTCCAIYDANQILKKTFKALVSVRITAGFCTTANQYIYLRQENEVNGGDTVFIVCVSLCLSVCAQRTGQSDKFAR